MNQSEEMVTYETCHALFILPTLMLHPAHSFQYLIRGAYYFYTKATVVSVVEMFEITVSNWII